MEEVVDLDQAEVLWRKLMCLIKREVCRKERGLICRRLCVCESALSR